MMKKHPATKKIKPWSFDDIVTDQDLWLPGLEYFFGRERGMNELADYARPCFEKLLMQRRKEAVNAINKITSDIQDQYNKALKDSRKEITVATTEAFINALMLQTNADINKVKWLKNGILVHNRDTGMLLHILPNQYLLFRGDTKCYFPNNTYDEGKTQREIGSSFAGAYTHKNYR